MAPSGYDPYDRRYDWFYPCSSSIVKVSQNLETLQTLDPVENILGGNLPRWPNLKSLSVTSTRLRDFAYNAQAELDHMAEVAQRMPQLRRLELWCIGTNRAHLDNAGRLLYTVNENSAHLSWQVGGTFSYRLRIFPWRKVASFHGKTLNITNTEFEHTDGSDLGCHIKLMGLFETRLYFGKEMQEDEYETLIDRYETRLAG